MKKIINLCLGALLSGIPLAGMGALQLAENGRSSYVVVLPDDAIPSEVTAATELSEHLNAITQAQFPVIRAAEYQGGPRIAIGFQPGLPETLRSENFPGLGAEELVIATEGDTLLLGGGRPRGSLYAVYEFLEELGVRWYTPQETVLPSCRDLTVAPSTRRYTSPFRSRTQVPGNGVTAQWCARNRMNSINEWGNPGEEYGNGVLQGPDMHTFWRILNPALFRQHPEWAAMVDGKRETETANQNWGVCLSQPDLRAYLVEQTMAWVRANPAYTDIWIGQNDGSPYCQCTECLEYYAAHGNVPSSLIVLLLNELAEAMVDEFPQKRIKTLAYGWSLEPPRNLKLAEQVTVMVCAGISQYASLGRDADGESFVANFRDWQEIASDFEIYLYSYPTDSSWFPSPCLYSQGRNIKWAQEAGIQSIHQELFGVGTGDGGELVYLRAWLYAQLMWHPDADIQTLIEDFCRGYYGEAADVVLAAIAATHQAVESGNLPPATGNISFAVPAYVDAQVIQEVNRSLDACYQKLSDPVLRRRVGYVWLPYLWADFWLGIPGIAEYDAVTGNWSIPISERAERERYGRLIKQFMIENGVGALRLGTRLNPHNLQLAEMTRNYPAVRLSDEHIEVVAVPECYGKPVALRRLDTGFQPLKPAWGMMILQYPQVGYWSESINGLTPERYEVISHDAGQLNMKSALPGAVITKRLAITDGVFEQEWRVVADRAMTGNLRTTPMLDLNPEGFGLYPVLWIGLKGGGWRHYELGRAGSMWYQTGAFDLSQFNGVMVLADTAGHAAVEFSIPPEQLGALSYTYDRYDFDPKGTGRMLELYFDAPAKQLNPQEELLMDLSMRILNADELRGKVGKK